MSRSTAQRCRCVADRTPRSRREAKGFMDLMMIFRMTFGMMVMMKMMVVIFRVPNRQT